MNEENKDLIRYAIKTEVEAVALYSKLVRVLPVECKETILHILKEEKEHIVELTNLLRN